MRSIFATILLFAMTLTPTAKADPLASPQDEVVLTVSGSISVTNVGDTAQFDMAMLKSFASESFETGTTWTEGTKTFTGVSLANLLDAVGAKGALIKASAINDYTVEIPVDSLLRNAPIIAYEMDYAPMSRRSKGPLWVVYPFDSDPQFQTEVIYSRSIWQLNRIEIVK